MTNLTWAVLANAVVVSTMVLFMWTRGVALLSDVRTVVTELTQVAATTKAAATVLLAHVEQLAKSIDRNYDGTVRMEANASEVAANLVVAQEKVDRIATDLAETHNRADQIGPGHAPGTASDAASRSDPNGGSGR